MQNGQQVKRKSLASVKGSREPKKLQSHKTSISSLIWIIPSWKSVRAENACVHHERSVKLKRNQIKCSQELLANTLTVHRALPPQQPPMNSSGYRFAPRPVPVWSIVAGGRRVDGPWMRVNGPLGRRGAMFPEGAPVGSSHSGASLFRRN